MHWKASSIPFVRRFERYLDFNFFEHQASFSGTACMGQHALQLRYLLASQPDATFHDACGLALELEHGLLTAALRSHLTCDADPTPLRPHARPRRSTGSPSSTPS